MFLKKHIFTWIGTPIGITSEDASHLSNCQFEAHFYKYVVIYNVTTPCNPQSNVEVSNRDIKNILSKIVYILRTNWSSKLDVTLWADQTYFKSHIEMSSNKLIFGKASNLPV